MRRERGEGASEKKCRQHAGRKAGEGWKEGEGEGRREGGALRLGVQRCPGKRKRVNLRGQAALLAIPQSSKNIKKKIESL